MAAGVPRTAPEAQRVMEVIMAMGSAARPIAFVLEVNSFSGLGAVRSLGRAGVPVVGLASDPRGFGFASRHGAAKRCPDPIHQPEALVEFLRDEGRRLDEPGVLLPASDAFVSFLARHGDPLRDHFRFNTPSPAVMEAGIDKRRQYEFAEQLGVPFPATHYPSTLDEVRAMQDRLDYPVFIKPNHAHLWRERFPRMGKGIKVHSPAELVAAYERLLPSGLSLMAQSIVPGPNSRHFNARAYISESGDVLATFTSRKLRQYPVEFGVGTMAESIHDPELIHLGLRYFQGIGFRGFGYIEFKRDLRDDTPRMIEFNARFSAQIIHSTDCGVNFPLIQYLDLADQPVPSQAGYKTGVRWLWAAGDLRSGWEHYRAGQISISGWARSWADARSFAVFAVDDPRPGLRYLTSLLQSQRRRVPGRPVAPFPSAP